MSKMLADLPIEDLWEIARNLGIGGRRISDKQYLIRLIKQRRGALAQIEAQRAADARTDAAARAANSDRVQPEDTTPPGEATDYASMDKDDLQALADERGLTVKGTGKDGNVLKQDLIGALEG